VANIPLAKDGVVGAVKVVPIFGIATANDGTLLINNSTSDVVKLGDNSNRPITPNYQHESTFYGLAKVAGHDEKDSTLPVGQYTDSAKSAIQSMLGIDTAIADAVGDITSFEF